MATGRLLEEAFEGGGRHVRRSITDLKTAAILEQAPDGSAGTEPSPRGLGGWLVITWLARRSLQR
jgi:hypothetical protein